MKKRIAYLLALSLTFADVFPIYAASSGDQNSLNSQTETQTEADKDKEADQTDEPSTDQSKDKENQEQAEDTKKTNPASQESNKTDQSNQSAEQEQESKDESEPASDTESESDPEQEEESELQLLTSTRTANGNQLTVSIGDVLQIPAEQSFSVEISGESEAKTLTIPGTASTVSADEEESSKTNNKSGSVTFSNLSEGTYTLAIKGSKYGTYTQTVEIEDALDCQVSLYNSWLGGYEYEEGKQHPGVICLGDVNGDGELTDEDGNAIVQVMQNQMNDSNTDLNGDGEVNLVDLQYFAVNSQKEGDKTALLQTAVSQDVVTAEIDKTKIELVEGDLKDLFTDDGNLVKFQLTNGATISAATPIQLGFPIEGDDGVPMEGMTIIGNPENPITSGFVEVETVDESGTEGKVMIPITSAEQTTARIGGLPITYAAQRQSTGTAVWDKGTLVIDFKGQVAVKKITLTITGTKSNNLAEISKVEFLNDMESRIPEPEMDIPTGLRGEPGSEEFTLYWNPAQNITGYEVEISDGTTTEVKRTTATMMQISSFNDEDVEDYQTYTVRVQSTNGAWRSGYSSTVDVTPEPTDKPDPPDNLNVTGDYRSISASWKKMKGTKTYNLYYKEESADTYEKIAGITANSYTITELQGEHLKDATTYEVYVTGVNDLGESNPSIKSTAKTINITPAQLPNYNRINKSQGEGELTEHIQNITFKNAAASIINSSLDEGKANSALGLADDSYGSYYLLKDWDDGVSYPDARGRKGFTVTLDQAYKVGYIAVAQALENFNITEARIYTDEGEITPDKLRVIKKKCENGRYYYLIKLPVEGVTSQNFRICLRHFNQSNLNVAEVAFYAYDGLEQAVMDLYADDLHMVLKEDVTAATLDDIQERLNEKVDGEEHMDKAGIQKELDTARDILNQENLNNVVAVNPNLTSATNGNKGFGGFNDWQPLGVSAYAGETITVYVGSNKGLKTGENTDLYLVSSQYHAESSKMTQDLGRLKIGKNEISVKQIHSLDAEKGGSLYVAYKGNNANDQYAVRVSGGVQIPVLNLYQITDDEERLAKTKAYVKELEEIVPKLETIHNEKHETADNESVSKYGYDEVNCIAGATEIMLDQMMYSVSSKQIYTGAKGDTVDEKAENLLASLNAMDQMMELFYQHKGLNNNATDKADKMPTLHLNIRYQRMFAGAFMYASGNHIGIEWPEIRGLATSTPITKEANGAYTGGRLFGWGIAHEIGHDINQSCYAVAEITNNYFAQLSTYGSDADPRMRFKYPDVYEKVTSNSIGPSSNGAVQLAMYWQLHLAYDKGYNYETYEDYQTQLDNLFFARVDTYARTTSKAPAPENIALTLGSDDEQNLMRLASAAAEKDLTEFFRRWGILPDETTKAYVEQFEEEERAIYYVCDSSRLYEIQKGSSAQTFKEESIVSEDTTAAVDEDNKNQVKFTLENTANSDVFLGYEIVRQIISNGEVEEELAGFTTDRTFTDTITTMNNRVITYKVTAIDKFLNRSEEKILTPVKIEHEGIYDKSLWSVELSRIDPKATEVEGTDDMPCESVDTGLEDITDNNVTTVFDGTIQDETGENTGKDVSVIVDFHQNLAVSGIIYKPGNVVASQRIRDYEIFVSQDKQNWTSVASGTFGNYTGEGNAKASKLYFTNGKDKWVCTSDASYLKLVIKGKEAGTTISIGELDIIGPSGDNVDFITAENGATGSDAAVGILKSDFKYATDADGKAEVIPKDSLVFVGQYKGNPAYNAVILYDESGKIVGGSTEQGTLKASQIILADVPEDGLLGTTSDGRWVYWIEPDDLEEMTLPKQVRAELYRVDNALTNEGQRLVSDSMFYKLPSELPPIELSSGGSDNSGDDSSNGSDSSD